MATGSEFQEQVRQLGKLITQFDQMPEGPQKAACKELVQLLMDVHGAGLERMMEIVFESGVPGPAIIDKLGRDTISGSLLLLYSLHPDDLETRVNKAMEHMRPRLRKLSCCADLVRIERRSRAGTRHHQRPQLRLFHKRRARNGGRRHIRTRTRCRLT